MTSTGSPSARLTRLSRTTETGTRVPAKHTSVPHLRIGNDVGLPVHCNLEDRDNPFMLPPFRPSRTMRIQSDEERAPLLAADTRGESL